MAPGLGSMTATKKRGHDKAHPAAVWLSVSFRVYSEVCWARRLAQAITKGLLPPLVSLFRWAHALDAGAARGSPIRARRSR